MPSRIEDYALIGDCRTAALVGRDGSIDWLCLPRFDSGACFASILGTSDHGRWILAPVEPIRQTRRRYREVTLVLETEHETENGVVSVIDFMPLHSDQQDLVRIVVGKRGQVRMHTELIIRFDYGSLVPWVRHEGHGIVAVGGPDTVHLQSPVELHGKNLKTVGEFVISEGERIPFILKWHPSHEPTPPAIDPEAALRSTDEIWRKWSSKCTYQGEWREAVLRSLITLKALTYLPTGGIVAAPTTSLPEQIGGVRNWDYRFCWLRDATFTLYSFLMNGYHEEAHAWRDWLLRAVAGRASQVNIMYGVAGERRLPETILPWLPGYEGSAPVRIGNAAYEQFQLDIFGEVMDALHLARRAGLQTSQEDWGLELHLLKHLESSWDKPDEGIWEVRGPKQHFTHSKLMAWVAVDRAVKDAELFGLPGPLDHWRRLRTTIHAEVCDQAFNRELNAFVQYYGANELDASVLMMSQVGFLPATDPRVVGTVAAIEKHLMSDGFVARYANSTGIDGLPPGEGAFLPCTFWLVDNYELQGRHAEARVIFERLLSIRNDVGLLAEEYDPVAKRLVGNFPQAFSHVGLINSARNLAPLEGPVEHRRNA